MELKELIKQLFPSKDDFKDDYTACIKWLEQRRQEREKQAQQYSYLLEVVDDDVDDDEYDPVAGDIWKRVSK